MRAPILPALAFALAFGGSIAGCSKTAPLPFAPAGKDAAPDPSTFGPYAVGVRTLTLMDPRRIITSSITGARSLRTLVTEVWYPADESARGKPGRIYRAIDLLPQDLVDKIGDDPKLTLETRAVEDAAPRREDETFPLVLFSHGNGGVRMQSTYFTVALASHGFIVVAPDHQGDTLTDFIRRGGLNPADVIGSYDDRADDMRFLIDHFTALPEGDPLAGLVDPARIGISGHSFGALTSVRTSGLDPRIRACVAQAPPGYTLSYIGVERMLKDLGIPMMLQSGGLDQTLPEDAHAASLWKEMGPPSWWLSLETAGHFTFSDLCRLDLQAIETATDIGVGNVIEDGCGPTNILPDVAAPLIRHFGIALFNTYLRGSAGSAAFLDAARAPAAGQTSTEVSLKSMQ